MVVGQLISSLWVILSIGVYLATTMATNLRERGDRLIRKGELLYSFSVSPCFRGYTSKKSISAKVRSLVYEGKPKISPKVTLGQQSLYMISNTLLLCIIFIDAFHMECIYRCVRHFIDAWNDHLPLVTAWFDYRECWQQFISG